MSSTQMQTDPILALVRDLRGRKVLPPCVLYARLGRGGMGAVYLGKHLTLLVKQVVKCLWLWGQDQTDEFVERFHQEARIAAEMTHQNLVRVTHVDRLGDLHYLVMEHVHGEDARRRVQRRGALDEAQALTLLLGAATGLGFAHGRGIVHRDIKPANLMVSTRGEVKVIDLGLARALHAGQGLTGSLGTLGTPQYMAPEQWDSARVGPEADVWALGATLYYLLAGSSHVPGGLDEPSAIRKFVCEQPFPAIERACPTLSPDTRRILLRCVARDPAERYPDARALAADLARLVSGDERLLADPAGAAVIQGDEPDDDEVRALHAELERGGAEPDLTHVMPRDTTQTVGPAGQPAVRTPLRTASAPPEVTRVAPGAVARPRRGWVLPVALVAALLVALGTAGVVWFRRPDPLQLQQEAMAAIYAERYDDAVALLGRLEEFPGFADQARRLLVDALVKDCDRLKADQPVAAMARLDHAARTAAQLLIAKDADDAQARIRAAREPLEDDLRQRIAGAVTVVSPEPDALVTTAAVPVLARIEARGLALTAAIGGQALAAGKTPGTWVASWQPPPGDGPRELQVRFEEDTTHVDHVVRVPVRIRVAPVALELVAPARPLVNQARLDLAGSVHNGPATVALEVTGPDGAQRRVELGVHDGPVAGVVEFPAGVDGEYRVRLRSGAAGSEVRSDEHRVLVDRTAPGFASLARPELPTRAGTWLLRGVASEPCRVFVRGREADAVATDTGLRFALPLPLPAGDGRAAFLVEARDLAGNLGAQPESVDVLVDRTAPRFVAGSVRHEPAEHGATLTVQGQLSEPGLVWSLDGEPGSTGPDGRFTLAVPLPPGAIEQAVTLRLCARDPAENPAPAHELTVFVDRKGPAILPDAPDGGWSAAGRFMLKLEDGSGPCRVALGSATGIADERGHVELPLVPSGDATVRVTATDRLGNSATRSIPLPRAEPGTGAGEHVAPGPTWGTPVADSAVDPVLRLHERVTLPIGRKALVLRLVRPLRDAELPPPALRDARALALLEGRGPFYLSETEIPVALWAEFVALGGAPSPGVERLVFDPRTCQSAPGAQASWQAPLHPEFLQGVPPAEREHWPVTQVTPDEARAFCQRFGLRLPHETEWLFVTRMGTRARYGWGNAAALDDRANLADLLLKGKAVALPSFETLEDGFAALAPVAALPRAAQAHPWGFKGLIGNAAEWCTTHRDRVVARGGSWLSEPRDLRVDELRADGLITAGSWDCVGFRVARDP